MGVVRARLTLHLTHAEPVPVGIARVRRMVELCLYTQLYPRYAEQFVESVTDELQLS